MNQSVAHPASASFSSAENNNFRTARLPAVLALASMLVGVLLIFWCYSTLSTTWDESAHIGTGMEWLARGVYTLDPIDPPLARVSTAVGPYLMGLRSIGLVNPWDEGNAILAAKGPAQLHTVLTAARLGILPYFLIAGFLVWRITRRWLGPWPAAIATFLFATCPPVLAHASLATTDMSFVAMFLFALDRLWTALQQSKWLNFILAGIGFGLACIAKLTALPYLTLCTFVFLAYVFWKSKKLPRVGLTFAFIFSTALTVWAGYHFSIGSLATHDPKSQQTVANAVHKFGPLGGVAQAVVDHLPAYQYFQGIRITSKLRKDPPAGYLFGEVYHGGRWYFYLLMLLLKTPIAFTLLALPGLLLALRRLLSRQDDFALVPLTGIVFPILVATLSHVNLGIRHVLVVYPFLAMLAALTCLALYSRSRQIAFTAVAILLGWQFISCLRVAPDFLTYLIEPIASEGSYVAIDSDYDWGQDIFRLRDQLNNLHANDVWIAYSGSADLNSYQLPRWKKLPAGQPVTGWIAISETMSRAHSDQYGWLSQYNPVAMAGHTIRIYHIQ